MSDLFKDAEKFADSHEKQVDEALDMAGKAAEARTGGKYDTEINAGVDDAEKHVGDGNPNN